MRLLIDARSMGVRPSGVGMYLYNFINALLEDVDYEIVLLSDVACSREIQALEQKGARVLLYGKEVAKSLGLYGYFRFVQKCIHQIKPDIFWEGNNMVPMKIVNPYGAFIVTTYDVFPVSVPEYYSKIYQIYFKHGIKNTLKYVDGIIFDSKDAQNETEKYFPKAKRKENFVSYIIIDEMPDISVKAGEYFLYMGNLERRKGVDLLLDAYEAYWKDGGRKELYLAGKIRETEIEQKLERLTKEISAVHYLGYITEEEKWKHYAECGCFLFPSKAEGFGMPVIEALNYGKPVIVSDLAIFKELEGELLTYFALTGKYQDEVDALKSAMLEYETPDYAKCQEIVGKYRKETLVKAMKKYMKTIADKRKKE